MLFNAQKQIAFKQLKFSELLSVPSVIDSFSAGVLFLFKALTALTPEQINVEVFSRKEFIYVLRCL